MLKLGVSLGDFHPALVHFPIVLVIMALVFDILYWYQRKDYLHSIANWIIIIAAVIIIPTAITGFEAKDFYAPNDPDVMRHQYMAVSTAIYTLAHALFRWYVIAKHKLFSPYLFILISLINVICINLTAEFGGIVVRGRGISSESLRPDGTPLPYNRVEKPQRP